MVCIDKPALDHVAQACLSYIKVCRRRAGPDGYDFVGILKACAAARALLPGRLVYSHVLESGSAHNLHVQNTLIDMHAKCGCLQDAFNIFDRMPKADAVTWNVMIAGCAHAHADLALQLWHRMHKEGITPDKFTFVCVLKVCSHPVQGKLVHNLVIESALECDVFIGTGLIDMYASCARITDAQSVFDLLPERNVVTWNALISGHACHGEGSDALSLFLCMLSEEVVPNEVTFVSILKACSSMASSIQGAHTYTYIAERSLDKNDFISSILIDMYSQCGCLDDGLCVFHMSGKEDIITWSALIAGLVRHGHDHQALSVFRGMQQSSLQVNAVIFVCILKACSNLRATEQGKRIHVHIIENGLKFETSVANAVIDMHIKCGCLKEAQSVFDELPNKDVVTWNSLVAGYAEHCHEEAFELFRRMQQEGEDPDYVTVISVLKACSRLANLEEGKHVHEFLKQRGFIIDILVRNALIDMYSKCGSLTYAQKLFNDMPDRDAVTWSALIGAFVQRWRGKDALLHFQQMLQEGINPNQGALVGALGACSIEAALYAGKLIHALVVDLNLHLDMAVGNTLIDMYANAGSPEDACAVFQRMRTRDEASWTSIISCFGRYDNYELAMQCFTGMQQDGLRPNDVTFVCLLTACSRIGLLGEACDIFCAMAKTHNIMLTAQHYNCMVDLMGRTNELKKAEELLVSMPFYLNAIGWSCLLGHCKTHGNVEIARRCFDKVITLDPEDTSAYSLMLSIYADAGMCNHIDFIDMSIRMEHLEEAKSCCVSRSATGPRVHLHVLS